MTVTVPADHQAEAAVIGIALYEDPAALPKALALLDPEDFHHPAHATLWAAITKLHTTGRPSDRWTLGDELRAMGRPDLVGSIERFVGEHVPLASRMPHYATIVVGHARRRLIQRATLAAAEAAADGGDPDEIADTLTAALSDLDRPDADQLPDRLTTVAEFLSRPEENRAPWVIPGLLRRDWRVVIVAPEGRGKSVVLRALAGYTAQGIHPFTGDTCPPVRALVVDLENPDEPLDETFRRIDATTCRRAETDPDRAWLWRCPEGMDIRTRTDHRRLERVLQHTRPDLVCLGPAYKLFTTRKGEDHEQVAGEVLSRLDSLRTRFGFGLAVEQHAPHGDSRGRELRPFGSSAWQRWPELGLTLDPTVAEAHGWEFGQLMQIGRFRGDRVLHQWPRWITRGRHLLWVGHYDTEPPLPPMKAET